MPTCLATDILNPPVFRAPAEPSAVDLQQGWAHSIAAPRNLRRPLVDSLAGVPKAALRTLLGEALTQKIWQSSCPQPAEQSRKVQSISVPADALGVPDGEIHLRMISYLACQAAQSLQKHSRLAYAVRLQFTFASGARTISRALFGRPIANAHEIRVAAQNLLSPRQSSFDPLAAINVTVETVAQELPKQGLSKHTVRRESSQPVS
jgi:hypothetical protein